jgi:PadR family transcriptional regulator PadR
MARNRPPSRQTRDVLEVLLTHPAEWRHGYELAKLAGLSSGTLYPLLIRLHERGMLEARWEEPAQPGRPARHVYRLSGAGRAFARSLQQSDGAVSLGSEVPA